MQQQAWVFLEMDVTVVRATGIPPGQKGAPSTVKCYPQEQAPVLSGILASLVVF